MTNILVTGASGGIGAAICKALAVRGAGTPLMAATPTLARESAVSESDRISAPRLAIAVRQRVYR